MDKSNELYLKKLLDMCSLNNIMIVKNKSRYYRIEELLQKCYEQQTIITYTYSIDINTIDTSSKINISLLQNNFTNLLLKLKELHELIDFITFIMLNDGFVKYFNDLIINNDDDKSIGMSKLKFNGPIRTINIDDLMMFQGLIETETTSSDNNKKSKKNLSNSEILYIEEFSN